MEHLDRIISEALAKAKLLIELKQYGEAEKSLYIIIKHSPKHSMALALLSICRYNQNKLEDAIQFATQSNAENINIQATTVLLLAYFYTTKHQQFRSICDLGKSKFPTEPRFYQYEAMHEKRIQRYKTAAKIVEEGLKLAPADVALHNLRGEILELRGKTQEAKSAFDTAIRLNPNDAQSHLNQGWYALRKGQFAEGRHFFQTSLSQVPHNKQAQRGYRLSLKNDVKWFKYFIRYIAVCARAAPLIVIGVIAGVVSQAGQIGQLLWTNTRLSVIVTMAGIGIILLFRLPFLLSALAGLQLYSLKSYPNVFNIFQKQKDQRHITLYCIGILLFLVFLFFTVTEDAL